MAVGGEIGDSSPQRDLRTVLDPSFGLLESKLHPPSTHGGTVPRIGLVDRLMASSDVRVLSIVAPPGYGKTAVMSQWAARTHRRTAWVSIDQDDNDPAVLLASIAAALDRVEPIDMDLFRTRAPPGTSIAAIASRRVASTLSSMAQPVALALDDVERLHNRECRDAIAELAVRIPANAQLVVASRNTPPLPTALLRARGNVVEIGVDDLAMDEQEARALLEAAGVELPDAEVIELVKRTEGWPVGLYLAALAAKGPRHAGAGIAFRGDDRVMADYLRSELLSRTSRQRVSFLTRTSVLDRMSGPLCDAVLNRTRSGRLLEAMEGSNLLLVPLDRQREWYRYHRLFRELLRAELNQREAEVVEELHSRAAAWCEANAMAEMAIGHAQAAGDDDRVARLVAAITLPTYAAGRLATVQRWFQWFDDRGLIERHPPIAVLGAVLLAVMGQPAAAERWAAAAQAASSEETMPDGSTMEAWQAQLRAFLCRDGIAEMRHDAEIAQRGLAPGSPWRATALGLEGVSYVVEGELDRADPVLAHAVAVAIHSGAVPAASVALAERAIVAIEREEWSDADRLAARALSLVRAGHLDDYSPSALVYAVAARTAVHRGDLPRARESLGRAARLRPLMTYALPFLAVQTLLEIVRANLALADAAGARVVLREVRDILLLRPDLGTLPQQAAELRSRLDTIKGGTVGASSLTTAELRLVPLLSTHLSFPEIGERLHISRHTVKTQAISVYRKLGVSSRSDAIERVREIGLLGW